MAADALDEARRLFVDAMDQLANERKQIDIDLKFSDPADPQQWDEDTRRRRESDPGGARPCLVFDQLGQYVSNVAGQIEQRPPSLHALPVGGGADRKTAESLDGFFRYVEYASSAQQHYARALTSAARAGVGYLIVRPTVTDKGLNWQEPRISSEGDPLKVVRDPYAVELDGSDQTFGFLLSSLSKREFKRKWPKFEPVSFDAANESNTSHDSDADDAVQIAEMWRIDTQQQILIPCVIDGEQTVLTENDYLLAQQRDQMLKPSGDPYSEDRPVVRWARMSGDAYLEDETIYPSRFIGLVPVYGYVGWSYGRMTLAGIPRRAMAAQRSYNYHMSEMHAYMASAPKAPWLVPARAIRGLEELWDRASVDARAYLPWHDVDEAGQPISPPTRPSIATSLQNHQAGAEQAIRDIQSAIGMYQANLGAPSNETSGVAIDARKSQGEASTAHFPAHLAASLTQVGRIVLDMLPRLVDKPRQMQMMGIDDTPSTVRVDPTAPRPHAQDQDGGVVINPNIGKYDVRVVVGASFSTQRSQAQAAYTEMMRANPAMAPALAPLWAQTLDVPHADKLAQVLTAAAPDPVRSILQPQDQQQDPAQLQAKINELQQALQEAIQHAQDAQAEADQAQQAAGEKHEEAEARDRELNIKAYQAETDRLKVMGTTMTPEQIQQITVQTLETMLQRPEPLEGEHSEAVENAAMQQGMTHEQAQEYAENAPEPSAAPEQVPAYAQAILDGHARTQDLLSGLIKVASARRIRRPVMDEAGNMTHVVDEIEPDEPQVMPQ